MKHSIRTLLKVAERAFPHYKLYDDCDGKYLFYPGGMVLLEDVLPWLRKTLLKILLRQRFEKLTIELGRLKHSNMRENWGPENGYRRDRILYLEKRCSWFSKINFDLMERDGLPKPWWNGV